MSRERLAMVDQALSPAVELVVIATSAGSRLADLCCAPSPGGMPL
jgi:hypothetical protein